jgi:hypothetical protein
MRTPYRQGRANSREHIARAVIGMPAPPSTSPANPAGLRGRQLAAWLAELWPHDEYAAIVTQIRRLDPP